MIKLGKDVLIKMFVDVVIQFVKIWENIVQMMILKDVFNVTLKTNVKIINPAKIINVFVITNSVLQEQCVIQMDNVLLVKMIQTVINLSKLVFKECATVQLKNVE